MSAPPPRSERGSRARARAARRLLALAALAVPGLLGAPAGAQLPTCGADVGGYQFVPLTGLEPGTFSAAALNDAGEVAGKIPAADPGDAAQVFVWQAGTLRTHAFPGSVVSALDIDENGVVLGQVRELTSGDEEVFLWDSRADRLEIVATPFPLYPLGFNDDHVIVGVDEDYLFGFALDPSTGQADVIAFGAVPTTGVGTVGTTAINDAGVAVGGEDVFLPQQGFYEPLPYRWTKAGGIEQLAVPAGGLGGWAVDVNAKGNAAGNVFDEFFAGQPALWTDGGDTLVPLGVPSNYFVASALALNVHDQVVVVAPNDLFGFTRGFVWDGGVYTDLSCFPPPGLFVTRPLDINDVGEILVQLTDAGGLAIVDIALLRPDQPFVAASELVQLGTPPNPAALLPGQTSGPVLGSVWDPVIDHTSFFPGADLDFLGLSLTALNVPLPPYGTLLCGPVLLSLFQPPGTPFALFLPDDSTLSGASLCAAGGSIDVAGTILLTNALEITLGSF